MPQSKCAFTSNIADMLDCSPDGQFDFNGFPVKECPLFPCEKYKKLNKEIDEMQKAVQTINKLNQTEEKI